ncbi:sce7726 family protein [Mycolicibacterium porcinum]|uniref:sce7726 family protein n=1 Tax=Mycolicibacterium porcinum TaxID=39693 RepID=UPI0031F7502E
MKQQARVTLANDMHPAPRLCKNRPMPATDLATIAGLFSRGSFRALASARPELADEFARRVGESVPGAAGVSIGDALDSALSIMTKQYRNEYVFKNSLVDRIVFGRHNPRTASALLELRAGSSIADVVIFNGTSTAYEIKTDLDDFSRLPSQLRCYEQCFERVAVVTSPRLAPRVLAAVPDHVGVLALSDRGSLSERRAPASGIQRLSLTGLFGVLRRQEVLTILRRTRDYEVDVPQAQLWRRTRDLFLDLSVEVAHRQVVDQLRARGMRAAAPAAAMPRSLRAMAYEVPLSTSATARAHAKLIAPASSFVR